MATLYENFLSGTITNNPLSNVATTINSASFANLPVVASPDIVWLTLDPDATSGAPEIVRVTAHTNSATSVTVQRAQQGTVARQHAVNTNWALAATAQEFGQGALRYTEMTDAHEVTTSVHDVPGMTVTFTAVAGRRYRAVARLIRHLGNIHSVRINEGGTILARANTAGSAFRDTRCEYITNASISGSKTWKMVADVAVTDAHSLDPGMRSFMYVEDIGPL